MDTDTIALILSGIAIIVSFGSLGWQIYDRLWLKGRLRVWCHVITIHTPSAHYEKFEINAVNLGPGKVSIIGVSAKAAKRTKMTTTTFNELIPESSTFGTSLPVMLDVGERARIILPYVKGGLLSDHAFDRVGVRDSFSREHWAPAKDLERAREQYEKDFP